MASPTASSDAALIDLLRTIANGPTVDPKNNWSNIDTSLKHEGKEIILPADPTNMPIPTAIDTLKRIEKQESQKFDTHEIIAGAPWDALVAIYRAMQVTYGVVLAESTKTFFGEIKPEFLSVHTGPDSTDRIQVPMGQMSLPGVNDPVHIGMTPAGAYIAGTVRKRDQSILINLAATARELLRKDSVYRGKAIRIGVDFEGNLDLQQQPEFIDTRRINESDMIHTAETEALIRVNVFSPLRHTEACRKNHIPLKRGVLLEGKYGTGKSLTARVTAKVATDNAWTFIVLDRASGLKSAIEFARNYQPCVIFAEDIDRAADREEESVNDLVNLIDGVITKDMEIMVVLTTNFIDKIDRALLRPGRFDAVISIQSPDAETAQRLIRAYARDLLAPNVDLAEVGSILSGQIPATIREVVERAKLSMLSEDRNHLTADDLSVSAIGMKRHMELLDPPQVSETPAEEFYNAFRNLFNAALEGDSKTEAMLGSLSEKVDGNSARIALATRTASAAKGSADAASGAASRAADLAQKVLDKGEKATG